MRLSGFERQAQRFARPEQMLLADHLVRRLRTQLLGQRHLQAFIDSDRKKVLGHRKYMLASASRLEASILTGMKPMRRVGMIPPAAMKPARPSHACAQEPENR